MRFSVPGVWYFMDRLGWSWQVRKTQAVQRDEEAIAAWRTKTGRRCPSAQAVTEGRWIVFEDEFGAALAGAVRRTWGQRGVTPVIKLNGSRRRQRSRRGVRRGISWPRSRGRGRSSRSSDVEMRRLPRGAGCAGPRG